jgi:1,4-alpha-glucan branching enzyme
MSPGYCSIVLHAHLPFVRHPEFEDCLEERWLFDAVLECYLPLLEVLEGWRRDGVPARLALSISPTLAAMLDDPLLRARCARYLASRLELAEREVERTRWDAAFHPCAQYYARRFRDAVEAYEIRYARDLVAAFASFRDSGLLELLACSATHAFLPLMQARPEAVRAQIETAVQDHAERYGGLPEGLWSGECGYFEGLDAEARAAELRYTFIDAHGLTHAARRPLYGVFAPAYGPSGLAFFARDPLASRVVWSADEGYPGHPLYREFYRDIGFDLDIDVVRPYIHDSGRRVATGLKYHRVTGRVDLGAKLPYDPDAARAQAERHADEFVAGRWAQASALAAVMDRPPLIVAPYDAELFGHWWHEGPIFLDRVMRLLAVAPARLDLELAPDTLGIADGGSEIDDFKSQSLISMDGMDGMDPVDDVDRTMRNPQSAIPNPQSPIRKRQSSIRNPQSAALVPITPSDYLSRHGVLQVLRPAYSSWGSGGYAAMWLGPECDWIYPLLDEAAGRMTRLARREARAAHGRRRRALNQMARELLLAQSSDWAFLMKTGSAADYAARRTRGHLDNFNRLAVMLDSGPIDELALADIESRTPIFPHLEFEVYA